MSETRADYDADTATGAAEGAAKGAAEGAATGAATLIVEDGYIEDAMLRAGVTEISNAVLRMPGVSHGAKLCYVLLRSHAGPGNTCFSGQDVLADLLGVSRRMVNRYLRELQRAGLIEVRRRGLGLTNVYTIKEM